jgi:hypothetical protein
VQSILTFQLSNFHPTYFIQDDVFRIESKSFSHQIHATVPQKGIDHLHNISINLSVTFISTENIIKLILRSIVNSLPKGVFLTNGILFNFLIIQINFIFYSNQSKQVSLRLFYLFLLRACSIN